MLGLNNQQQPMTWFDMVYRVTAITLLAVVK